MCGLYGIFSRTKNGLFKSDIDNFVKMGIVTQLRGTDSSGVFAVPPKAGVMPKIVKAVGPSCFLNWDKGFEEWAEYALKTATGIVGHGRAATKGKVTKENAHPFRSKPITLVHNGTIHSGLDHHKDVDVDSQALCMEIQQKGIYDALHGISGAYAIIAYNEEENKTYLARNAERPLHILQTHDKFYVMSEYEALYFLAKREKFTYAQEPEIKYLEPGKVYTIDGEGNFYKEGEVPPKKYTPPTYTSPTHTGGSKWKGYENIGSGDKAPSIVPLPKYKKGDKIEFTVMGITGPINGTNVYSYRGQDDEKNYVYFQTPGMDNSLFDRVGVGTCVHVLWEDGAHRYQVKARSIKWDSDDKYVLTYDGELLEEESWNDLVENETCDSCNSKVDKEDHEKTLVLLDGGKLKMYCKNCISGAHTDGMQAEDIKRILLT